MLKIFKKEEGDIRQDLPITNNILDVIKISSNKLMDEVEKTPFKKDVR